MAIKNVLHHRHQDQHQRREAQHQEDHQQLFAVLLACSCQRIVDVIWITRCQDATSKSLIASEVASEMVDQIPMMFVVVVVVDQDVVV